MIPVIDMHCDSFSKMKEETDAGKGFVIRENAKHIDLVRMKEAGYMCQNFALFTFLGHWMGGQGPYADMNLMEFVTALSDLFDEQIGQNSDIIRPVRTGTEIEKNFAEGYMSALKTIEEGAVYEGALWRKEGVSTSELTDECIKNLKIMYDKGVRMSTLTWNFENALAYPNFIKWETPDGAVHDSLHEPIPFITHTKFTKLWNEANTAAGLKETGVEFARACEELGVIMDVSHLGDKGIWDLFDVTKKDTPIMASHSNARAVTGHPRNLTDEMLKAIADRGGVCGINFSSDFLNDRHDNMSTIADMVAHIKYIRDKAGIGIIGLGTDFDGIDNAIEFGGCHGMQQLADALFKEGFSSDEVEAIFYKNVLNLYKRVIG